MNIKINETLIASDLNDLNFTKLKKGDQIILLKQQHSDDTDTYFNDLQVIFINSFELNIVSLQQHNLNYDLYTYEEDNTIEAEIDSSTKCLDMLILDKNNFIKVKTRKYEYKHDDNSDYNRYFIKFKNLISETNVDNYFSCNNINYKEKQCEYLYYSKIDNIYFCYICEQKINNEYSWAKSEKCFILGNDNIYYYIYDFKITEIIEWLNKSYGYSYNFKDFKIAYKIFNYTIDDYIKDNTILNDIQTFYLNIPFISFNYIEKFFKPIYKNDEWTSYFKSMYNNNTFSTLKNVYSVSRYKDKYDIYQRISETIKSYLLGNEIINPFTGGILEQNKNKYSEFYRTAEHLIIQKTDEKHSYDYLYYYLHYNIFVVANKNEIKEIIDLKRTIDTLCQ